MIDDIDKARPEVVIQVQVLEARLDKMRNLGILPGQIGVDWRCAAGNNDDHDQQRGTNTNGTTSTTQNILTLQNLTHLNGSNYSVTLPSFTANALLNDSIDEDYSESGSAVGGWTTGKTENRRSRAGGDGQLPGGCRRGLDGGNGIRKPVGEHAIPVHRRRRERGHHAARAPQSRSELEGERGSFVGHGANEHRRHSAADHSARERSITRSA